MSNDIQVEQGNNLRFRRIVKQWVVSLVGFSHISDADVDVLSEMVEPLLATVRREQIAQDIQLAKDVWEDGLKDERSALQMKAWIIDALTRQDRGALVRVRKEEREAAFRDVLMVAKANLKIGPTDAMDTGWNLALAEIITALEASADK